MSDVAADAEAEAAGANGAEEQPHFMGYVKTVNAHFSTLSCPDSGYDTDVHVAKSIADPKTLKVGDTLAFTLELGQNDRPQAAAPVWKLVGPVPAGKPVPLGEYAGQIREVAANGIGLVECPEVSAQQGRDACVLPNVMRECGLAAGDIIAFALHNASRPQISSPCWKSLSLDYWMQRTGPEEGDDGEPYAKRQRWDVSA